MPDLITPTMSQGDRVKTLVDLYGKYKNKKKVTMGKTGICGVCGEERTVTTSKNKLCCSVCKIIRGAAKNKPEIVVDQLREWHGDKYLICTDKGPDTDEAKTLVESMTLQIEDLSTANDDLAKQVMELEQQLELYEKGGDSGNTGDKGETVQILSLDKLILNPDLLKAVNVLAGEISQ